MEINSDLEFGLVLPNSGTKTQYDLGHITVLWRNQYFCISFACRRKSLGTELVRSLELYVECSTILWLLSLTVWPGTLISRETSPSPSFSMVVIFFTKISCLCFQDRLFFLVGQNRREVPVYTGQLRFRRSFTRPTRSRSSGDYSFEDHHRRIHTSVHPQSYRPLQPQPHLRGAPPPGHNTTPRFLRPPSLSVPPTYPSLFQVEDDHPYHPSVHPLQSSHEHVPAEPAYTDVSDPLRHLQFKHSYRKRHVKPVLQK